MRPFWRYTIIGFGIIVFLGILLILAVELIDNPEIVAVANTMVGILGLYMTFILFLHSQKVGRDRAKKHLDHLQELHEKQMAFNLESTEKYISELRKSADQQIQGIRESTQEQIKENQKSTELQISELQRSTERQIDALQTATNDQIQSFEHKMTEMIQEMTDNSLLLGEVLGRQLEEALVDTEAKLYKEQREMENVKSLKLFRLPADKKRQIQTQQQRIDYYERAKKYFSEKYEWLQRYIRGLNG